MSFGTEGIEPSIRPDGVCHTGVRCPKCGADMTEFEYQRQDARDIYIWTTYRKCSNCGHLERILG